MGNAKARTTIVFENEGGMEIELTAHDCAEILNAMARSKMLEVMAVAIPAGAEDLWTEECFAFVNGEGEVDDKVVLEAECSTFSCMTPRKKATPKRKK